MTRQGFIIAVVLALLGLRACIPSHSQVMLPHRHGAIQLQSTGFTPDQDPFLRYYWVASDAPVGSVTTWTDRVHGAKFIAPNGGVAPSNSTNDGMFFNGAQWMTNDAPFAYTNVSFPKETTYFIIITPLAQPATFGFMAANFHSGSGGDGNVVRQDLKMYYGGNIGSVDYGSYSTGVTLDVTMVVTNGTLGGNRFFTNGVLALASDGQGVSTQAVLGCALNPGVSTNSFLKGYIREFLYLSNGASDAVVQKYHKYATNKYGYSP